MIGLALTGIKFFLVGVLGIAFLAGAQAAYTFAGKALTTVGIAAGAVAHNADNFMEGYKAVGEGSKPKKLAPGPVPPNATSASR